jgi:aromatic ring-opening dioxygenase catalytic subunit (LigB family)
MKRALNPRLGAVIVTGALVISFKLVAAQGMNRRQWEESFQLMIDKHGMANIGGDDRKLVLDYLEQTYPQRAPSAGGGWQNPFLKR